MNRYSLLLGTWLLAGASVSLAEQTTIEDYEEARDDFFWPLLMVDGGTTLYCNIEFDSQGALTVEHVYAAQWMAEAVGCPNRNDCDSELFHHAEADLHNLWAAHRSINSSRGNRLFSEIPGEDRRRFTNVCEDYERTSGAEAVVEPQDQVKGDIARSILYMAFFYDFPLHGMGPMLLDWHFADPPDSEEVRRNNEIESLQGTRNPFIDMLADSPMQARLPRSPSAPTEPLFRDVQLPAGEPTTTGDIQLEATAD